MSEVKKERYVKHVQPERYGAVPPTLPVVVTKQASPPPQPTNAPKSSDADRGDESSRK